MSAPARAQEAVARYLRNQQLTWEWQAVRSLRGRIIDTATPEQRAARETALAKEMERLRQAEKAPAGSLPAVASFW